MQNLITCLQTRKIRWLSSTLVSIIIINLIEICQSTSDNCNLFMYNWKFFHQIPQSQARFRTGRSSAVALAIVCTVLRINCRERQRRVFPAVPPNALQIFKAKTEQLENMMNRPLLDRTGSIQGA